MPILNLSSVPTCWPHRWPGSCPQSSDVQMHGIAITSLKRKLSHHSAHNDHGNLASRAPVVGYWPLEAIMEQNNKFTGQLTLAIERAARLNHEACAVLEKAVKAAYTGGVFSDDYRVIHAEHLLEGTTRQHNVAVKYFRARDKRMKSLAAKAGR
jgi:hypothetical protein